MTYIPDYGPQGEILLVEHSFRFSIDQPRESDGKFASSGTTTVGDVKTTTYTSQNRTVVVEHNTKDSKVLIKHLDSKGDLLVQYSHDSIGAARKDLASQGIEHKFFALRFDTDQPRDKDGKFSMGNVASFKNENDGVTAHVTSYNGKFHVNLIDDDSGNSLPPSIYSGDGAKEKAIGQAQKLAGVKK